MWKGLSKANMRENKVGGTLNGFNCLWSVIQKWPQWRREGKKVEKEPQATVKSGTVQ